MERRQHEVAGECGLDGDLRRLVVTNLTEQHNVGVGTQDGSQRGCEREAGLDVHLHLVDAGDAVLNRVLDRDHVDLGPRHLVERRVQRRGLTGTRRPGDEDHAVRLGVRLRVGVLVALAQAKVLEVERCRGVVEDTHDDLLAPHRGKGRDAKVDLAPLVVHREATILRLAALGNVDFRHDLEARRHTRGNRLWRALHLVEHAVNAVAHHELVFAGLDVNIRGTVLDGLA